MRTVKILFWVLISLFTVAAVSLSFASSRMTVGQNALVWSAILCVVFAAMAGFIAYLLFWCWEKRIAIIAGRYGGGR